MKRLTKQLMAKWKDNPYCQRCGVLTILPQDVPGKINTHTGVKQIKKTPDNMATIQHIYDKLHPLRLVDTNDARHLLWCNKCNSEDAKQLNKRNNNPTMKKNITAIAINDEEGILVDQLHTLIAGYDHAPSVIYLLYKYRETKIEWPTKVKDYEIIVLAETQQFAFARF